MKTKELDTATITFNEQNMLLVKYKNDVEVDLEEMIELVDVSLAMVEESTFYLLLDAQNIMSSITHEAKEYLTNHPEYDRLVIAVAIIVSNLPIRIIANFFKNFHHQPNPIRVFNNFSKGKSWLMTY